MEFSIGDIIQDRFQNFAEKPKETLKLNAKERTKKYNDAVKCFQVRINKDRVKEKKPLVPFMAVKMKLAAINEVDDLRSWYKTCLDYSYTRDPKTLKRKTFSQCFFGGTKCK